MLHQLPANSSSSFFATHVESAQTTTAVGLTIHAAYRQEALSFKNGKQCLTDLRESIRSRLPLFLRTPHKAKALLLALDEHLFNYRCRPIVDLDNREHFFAERSR